MRGTVNHYTKPYTLDRMGVYIYVLGVSTLCWIIGYIDSVGYPVYGEMIATPLWNTICRILPGKLFTYLIGILLMFGGAYLLHRANYALGLIREKTLLPFLLYVLLLSTNLHFFPLKPTSIGSFCLILAIYQLFTSYHDPESNIETFTAALFIGIGSLLWVHTLLFLPLFWVGMYNFRSLSPKTFTASLLGVSTVYWFVLGWSVWQGDYSAFTVPFPTLYKVHWLLLGTMNWIDWICLAYIVVLIVLASANIRMHEYDDNPRTRQFLSFLILFAVWSFVLFFLYEDSAEEYLQVLCIPAALLIAHFITVIQNKYTCLLFHLTVIFYVAFLFLRLWNS